MSFAGTHCTYPLIDGGDVYINDSIKSTVPNLKPIKQWNKTDTLHVTF